MWNVIFFETARGEKIVKKFIFKQTESTRGKIIRGIDLLKKYGPILGMPNSKQLTNKIHELRIRGQEEIRIFYGFTKHNIYLLHAFKKKTQKTPSKEIETASERLALLT